MCFTGSCPYEYNRGESCRKPGNVECWLESDAEDIDEYRDRIADAWEEWQPERLDED